MSQALPPPGSQVRARRGARLIRSPFAMVYLLVSTAVLMSTSAQAQPQGLPEVELERLLLNPSGQGSLLLGTGEVLPGGAFRASLLGHYEHEPLVLYRGEEKLGAVVKQRVTAHLTAAYGLSNRLEVALQVPVLLMQHGDDLTAQGVGTPREGLSLGTPYLSLRFGILSERDEKAVDLAVGVQAGLPLGSAEALARDSFIRALPSVMVGKRFGFLRAALDAGVSLRPSTTFSGNTDVKDALGNTLHLGGVLATTGKGLRGELNVMGDVPFQKGLGGVETLVGVRMPLTPSLEGFAMAGVGLDRSPGTPAFRGLLGVAFTSQQ